MKVLVTGATGFVGKHLINSLLARRVKVFACGNTRKIANSSMLTYFACDILDSDSVAAAFSKIKPTHLVHLAWGLDEKELYSSPKNLEWLRASQHLMQQFAITGGKRFVGVGTCVEYSPVNLPRHESQTPTLPNTLYGKSKLACGECLQVYADGFGFSSAWARLFYLLGPGEKQNRIIPAACKAIRDGREFHCANANSVLDYMDVRDAAEAIASLLFSDLRGVVNVASGNGIQLRELLLLLENSLGEKRHSYIRFQQLEKVVSILADITRLSNELNFRPSYTLEESLKDCCNYVN